MGSLKAIISDIHANLEALKVVLDDINGQGIKEIYCLGDVVGYGPQPIECLELVKKVSKLNLLGNHEEAVLQGIPANFTPRARKALEWTQHILLTNEQEPADVREARRKFMNSFQIKVRLQGVTYVHGSPRGPTREYVLPKDAQDKRKMKEIFAHMEDWAFCGHTHTPGVFSEEGGFAHPSELMDLYILESGTKALINVGSVGQPRDGDPRACYATFDGNRIEWRRVEYNIERTVEMIHACSDLDPFLGDRLREGK